jgi:streptogramin lyase
MWPKSTMRVVLTTAMAAACLLSTPIDASARGKTVGTTEYKLPNGIEPGAYAFGGEGPGLTEGPGGSLWFPYFRGYGAAVTGGVGRITRKGTVRLFPIPSVGVSGVVRGPDGAVWFSGSLAHGGVVGRISELGVVTLNPLPAPDLLAKCASSVLSCADDFYWQVLSITLGSDGNLWAVGGLDSVWRITPSGTITAFHTPTESSWPSEIVTGDEGELLVTETAINPLLKPRESLAHVTPTGLITETPPLASAVGGRRLTGAVVAMPDGSVWLGGQGFIEYVSPTGAVTKQTVRHDATAGVRGSDGKVWFITYDGHLLSVGSHGIVRDLGVVVHRGWFPTGISNGPGSTLWLTALEEPTRGHVVSTAIRIVLKT